MRRKSPFDNFLRVRIAEFGHLSLRVLAVPGFAMKGESGIRRRRKRRRRRSMRMRRRRRSAGVYVLRKFIIGFHAN